MDFTEADHIGMLRKTVKQFVAQHMPRAAAAKWDRENQFPRDVFERLVDIGVMGLTVPEEYGGSGRDIPATMMVIEELSRRSLAVSVPFIMSACYAGMNLVECGSDEQKRTLLPLVAGKGLMFAYGWTEPDIGADVAGVKTSAIRDGDHLIVNGSKRFCSGADICDYIYTLVRTGPAQDRHRNLSFLLIPPKTPGIEIRRMDMMGMKGAATTDVSFTNVRVPVSSVIGGEAGINRGWTMITGSGLDVEKLEVAAISLGIAGAAIDDAWAYAEQRKQFGKSIGSYQAIRHKLADMLTQIHAARLMMSHAAWLADRGERCGIETSMTKLFVTEVAKNIALECQTVQGAYGYSRDLDTERYVRDGLLMPIIGGSSSIQRNNIVNWSGLDKT